MKTILLKLNDSVELFNGTKGNVVSINKMTHEITISSPVSIPQKFHKVNIKTINEKPVDDNYIDM